MVVCRGPPTALLLLLLLVVSDEEIEVYKLDAPMLSLSLFPFTCTTSYEA